MPLSPRRVRAALLVALAAVLPSAAHAALGLCRQEAARSDGYMQLLCAGESALEDKQPRDAIRHFSDAAGLQRLSASNELAWAGLAAAHCQAGDAATGRDWLQRFDTARRLWIGELSCQAASGEPNPKVAPPVHRQLCSDALAADYAIVRARPQSAVAQDVRLRLDAVNKAVTTACGATAQATPAAQTTKKAATRRKPARASGKTASPSPGK